MSRWVAISCLWMAAIALFAPQRAPGAQAILEARTGMMVQTNSDGYVLPVTQAGLGGRTGPGADAMRNYMIPEGMSSSAVQAPVLKWQRGGCYSSWCETGWYSSPAAADLDNDGQVELIGAAYTLFVLNGTTGALEWSRAAPGGGGRVWPGVAVADLEGDGDLEIVTAHGGGYVRALDHLGNPLWTAHPVGEEFRSLALGDLDADGDLEIVAGRAELNRSNAYVFEHTGAARAGWPQLAGSEGSAAGIYNDTIGLGDLDGDERLELVIPSDTITIAAYRPDGTQLATNTLYHDHPGHDMDLWSEVPAYINLAYEVQGYGPCSSQFTPRANFAIGPANVTDLNSDGVNEVVAIGNVHDCHTSPYTDVYNTPYVLNADRTRFKNGSYDWTTPPVNTGAPLSMDYNVIENIAPNPVTVDLDNDGQKEILFPSYDGRLHAFWLDKTEHGAWPYAVYNPAEGFYRFPGEPLVADLDDNGTPEVIFASWPTKGNNRRGRLHILDNQGQSLHTLDLPAGFGANWNGAMAAPTLANIDADADLELIVNTAHSGLVAYDLPGSANARVLWGTGRGGYLRNGLPARGSLLRSSVQVTPVLPATGEVVTLTITLRNPGPLLEGVTITSTLPAQTACQGSAWASSGSVNYAAGVLSWSGDVPAGIPVTASCSVQVGAGIAEPLSLRFSAQISDGFGSVLERGMTVVVNGEGVYLPLMRR